MKTIELIPNRLLASAHSLYELNGHPYHNWHHVTSVFAELDAYAAAGNAVELATALAALGHDLILETRMPAYLDNETRSAEIFAGMLGAHGIDDVATVERVAQLIILTNGRSEPAADDLQAQAFIDADYAIVGQTPAVYRRYSQAIRTEVRHLSDEEFKERRTAFLAKTLARSRTVRLFRTDFFHQRYEDQAVENMEHELANLGKGTLS